MARIWTYLAGAVDGRDLLLGLGLILLAVGCWQVWPPAALLAPGSVLTYIAVFGIRP
jgi:uncharacterized membrane protein